MKRDLVLWGHGSSDDEKVASDLANFTDGKVQLDLDTFKFDKVEVKEQERRRACSSLSALSDENVLCDERK